MAPKQSSAEERFRRVLAMDPTDGRAYVGLSRCYEKRGQLDRAWDLLQARTRGGRGRGGRISFCTAWRWLPRSAFFWPLGPSPNGASPRAATSASCQRGGLRANRRAATLSPARTHTSGRPWPPSRSGGARRRRRGPCTTPPSPPTAHTGAMPLPSPLGPLGLVLASLPLLLLLLHSLVFSARKVRCCPRARLPHASNMPMRPCPPYSPHSSTAALLDPPHLISHPSH